VSAVVAVLRRSTRVVAVQPWMVRDLGPGPGVWFAQLLWRMEVADEETIVAADHSWETETGLGRDQVLRARRKVEAAGWITCQVRKVAGTPTTRITLAVEALDAHLRAIHCANPHSPGSCGSAQSSSPQTDVPTGQGEKDTDCALVGFDDFWTSYPRRARRTDAQRAWRRAIAVAPAAAVVAGARRYAAETAGSPLHFLAHPASWLDARRWEDEPGANQHTERASSPRPRLATAAEHGPSGPVALEDL
jgi:hypothetical protein